MSNTNDDGTTAGSDASGVENDIEGGATSGNTDDSTTTRVNFDITVPAYMSNALQVNLVWGDVEATAIWNNDEHWTASVDLPISTTNQLLVTFSDANGAVILGSFETPYTTGMNQSESFQIEAIDFDTDKWDSDADGDSNLSESIAGTYTEGNVALEPVQATLELVADKTFRIAWQSSSAAQFYRVMENPDGVSGFSQVSDDIPATQSMFDHRVALYSRFDSRYIVQACDSTGCVGSDELAVSGALEQAIGYFKADNTEFESLFGGALSLSADGNTLAVGASGTAHTDERGESDFVYIFERSQGIWSLLDILRPNSDDGYSDGFGRDVSLAADGNTLAVGASRDDSVYIFERVGFDWQQRAYLKATNGSPFDDFGISVSLDAAGNTLSVGASAATGAINDQNSRIIRNGVVYMFELNDTTWQQQAALEASNAESFELFGRDVSLSSDGNTLAVGATQEDSAATGVNGDQSDNSARASGAVYLFEYANGIWQQQAYIKASNTELGDIFGWSVSLSFDGNTLAVGAQGEKSAATGVNGNQSDNSAAGSGAVYVFERSGDAWQQQAYLKSSSADNSDSFGATTSLSSDGNLLAIGTSREDSAATGVNGDQNDNSAVNSGAVYVFERINRIWQQRAYLKASNSEENDLFGIAIALSADGSTLAVGANYENSAATGIGGDQNDNTTRAAGAVYLY